MTPDKIETAPRAQRYWQRTRRMTVGLLLVWFVVTFLSIFFARQLAGYTLFGWPVSFFMAARNSRSRSMRWQSLLIW